MVPYGVELGRNFRAKYDTDMRFFDMFLSLINAVDILHAHQRDRDEKGRVLATLRDYEIAREVFSEFETAMVYGVGKDVIDFYEKVIEPAVEDWKASGYGEELVQLTYYELRERYSRAYGKGIGKYYIGNAYIEPLQRVGLVDVIEDQVDRRRRLIVLLPLKRESLINDEGFKSETAGKYY